MYLFNLECYLVRPSKQQSKIGDWGLGIGDWGLGQSPIPNPQSPILSDLLNFY